jgi:hypothetical protein
MVVVLSATLWFGAADHEATTKGVVSQDLAFSLATSAA